MDYAEESYELIEDREAVVTKDWAAGSPKPATSIDLTVGADGVPRMEQVTFPPALWKIVDEVVVNAVDHAVKSAERGRKVSKIHLNCYDNGNISVYNDGPGIRVATHEGASKAFGREILNPTFLFGYMYQGSKGRAGLGSITGGVNGMGAKITNWFSSEFIVQTCDGSKYFGQKWVGGCKGAQPPVVLDMTDERVPQPWRHPHTSIVFKPDYSLFHTKFCPEFKDTMDKLFRARMWYAAAYLGFATRDRVDVRYNGVAVPVRSMREIADRMFPLAEKFETIVRPEIAADCAEDLRRYHYEWQLIAVVVESKKQGGIIGNINGIPVLTGTHVDHLTAQLKKGVVEKTQKSIKSKDIKIAPQLIMSNLFILTNCTIPAPSWSGQRKDHLATDIKLFANYKIPPKFLTSVSTAVSKILETKIGTKKHKKGVKYDKYTPAGYAGGDRAGQCSLIVTEGDSAMNQMKTAVSVVLGLDYYGLISTGGVIMNARDRTIQIVGEDGETRTVATLKLSDNIFFRKFTEVLGLDPSYKYIRDGSAEYKRKTAKLRYGSVVICVDQDHDGKGNILGLILNMFHVLWPGLIESGFVKWFCTPIIRMYPRNRGKVVSFYTIQEYERFVPQVAYNKPLYYKGLGTHSREETIEMVKSMSEHLYTFTLDDRADDVFEVYFGADAKLRKVELARPTAEMTEDEVAEREETKTIPCSRQLETDTNLYQKDNIERKLNHIIDGQNQAGRKVLDGVMKAFQTRKVFKVSDLAGFITEHEHYHHGPASLCDVITGKGFLGTGGRQLPFIVPMSCFGSRATGGPGDAASARYINAAGNNRLNNILFPREDYPNLEFVYDEDKKSEPKYFVPIIPLAIIESTSLPGHGWRMQVWGRDVFDVIKMTRLMINGARVVSDSMVNTYRGTPYEWRGRIETINCTQYSFGTYEVDCNTVKITELPLRVWTTSYLETLDKIMEKDKNILKYADHSIDYKINIVVTFVEGFVGQLQRDYGGAVGDGIETYLRLYSAMNSDLNFYGTSSEVIELKYYQEVYPRWFPVRREFYAKRLARAEILARIGIELAENRLKYVKDPINTRGMKLTAVREALAARGYPRYVKSALDDHADIRTEDLRATIVDGPTATYDYILNVTEAQKSDEGIEDFEAKLAALREKLREILEETAARPFAGARIWRRELDELEEIVRYGIKTEWKYEDYGKYTY